MVADRYFYFLEVTALSIEIIFTGRVNKKWIESITDSILWNACNLLSIVCRIFNSKKDELQRFITLDDKRSDVQFILTALNFYNRWIQRRFATCSGFLCTGSRHQSVWRLRGRVLWLPAVQRNRRIMPFPRGQLIWQPADLSLLRCQCQSSREKVKWFWPV